MKAREAVAERAPRNRVRHPRPDKPPAEWRPLRVARRALLRHLRPVRPRPPRHLPRPPPHHRPRLLHRRLRPLRAHPHRPPRVRRPRAPHRQRRLRPVRVVGHRLDASFRIIRSIRVPRDLRRAASIAIGNAECRRERDRAQITPVVDRYGGRILREMPKLARIRR